MYGDLFENIHKDLILLVLFFVLEVDRSLNRDRGNCILAENVRLEVADRCAV